MQSPDLLSVHYNCPLLTLISFEMSCLSDLRYLSQTKTFPKYFPVISEALLWSIHSGPSSMLFSFWYFHLSRSCFESCWPILPFSGYDMQWWCGLSKAGCENIFVLDVGQKMEPSHIFISKCVVHKSSQVILACDAENSSPTWQLNKNPKVAK